LVDREIIAEIVAKIIEMLDDGIYDPKFTEIAKRLCPEDRFGRVGVEEVLKNNHLRIRQGLEDAGIHAAPLSPTYYQRFRKEGPKTELDARRCLPGTPGAGGRRLSANGLLLLKEGETRRNMIWAANQSWRINVGAVLAGKNLRKVDDADARGIVPDGTAEKLRDDAAQSLAPAETPLAIEMNGSLELPALQLHGSVEEPGQ
jgi:hypothetical protein